MSAIGKCPWPGCGGEGEAPDILGFFSVQCQKCGASGPISPREDGAITAWNRLATPDPAEVRGRIRWARTALMVGKLYCGHVRQRGHEWWAYPEWEDGKKSPHPTEAAARAALVAAVREAIQREETT